jgi:hypothetical protein
MNGFPKSENAALSALLDAIRKRSRALSHKCNVTECERVVELKDGEEHERIELRLQQRSRSALKLTFWMWDDRWCWFDARRGSKSGWTFEWTYEGRLSGDLSGRDLVDAIERTHELIATDADVTSLNAIWRPMLMRGPQA